MQTIVAVYQVFDFAGLVPKGPVRWGQPIEDRCPGVYVVSLVREGTPPVPLIDVPHLHEKDRVRWLAGQPVIYIGRARNSVHRRINQFYRHRYGNRGPHRGGQAALLMPEQCRWVFWAPALDPVHTERAMIDGFIAHVGCLPYANRRR